MFLGWTIVRISGASMEPLLKDGDYALARRLTPRRATRPGDIVLLNHPHYGPMVKRVMDEPEPGRYRIEGLSASSTTRADLGIVDAACIRARLVLTITPDGVRRLPRTQAGFAAS